MVHADLIESVFKLNDKNPPIVVAEIGINHNGDIEIAKQLIDVAVVAGFDYVKLQKRDPDLCVPENKKN
jgi:N-acetylneuraminate synthase